MFTATVITNTPCNKRFMVVGRVPGPLLGKTFATLDDAKVAVFDCQIAFGECFPVKVSGLAV